MQRIDKRRAMVPPTKSDLLRGNLSLRMNYIFFSAVVICMGVLCKPSK